MSLFTTKLRYKVKILNSEPLPELLPLGQYLEPKNSSKLNKKRTQQNKTKQHKLKKKPKKIGTSIKIFFQETLNLKL